MASKIKRSALFIIGFLLSPLSWWNDLFVNLPLAYAFSFPFSLISQKLFLPSFILGYLLTNVLGFVLMHKGIYGSKEKNNLKKSILIALGYTLLAVLLVALGVLKAPLEYLGHG